MFSEKWSSGQRNSSKGKSKMEEGLVKLPWEGVCQQVTKELGGMALDAHGFQDWSVLCQNPAWTRHSEIRSLPVVFWQHMSHLFFFIIIILDTISWVNKNSLFNSLEQLGRGVTSIPPWRAEALLSFRCDPQNSLIATASLGPNVCT